MAETEHVSLAMNYCLQNLTCYVYVCECVWFFSYSSNSKVSDFSEYQRIEKTEMNQKNKKKKPMFVVVVVVFFFFFK